MKTPLPLTAVAFALCASVSFGADTAYSALRVASTKVGRDSQNRVIELSGKGGSPQPFIWRVVVADSGNGNGCQEVEVQRGRIVGQRRLAFAPAGARLSLSAIQLDSDGVFTVANGEAIRAGVTFDRLDYTLTSNNQAGLPMWKVDLFDGPSNKTGSLKIAADTAAVLERSPELALTEEQKRAARWSKPGQEYRSVPDFFHRMWKRTEKTGYKLKNWANGYGWTADQNPPIPEN